MNSAVLQVYKEKKQVTRCNLTSEKLTMGRSKDCGLQLDETLISKKHAEIILENGVFWLQDLGSKNGTLLRGERLSGRKELKDGDEIVIGGFSMKFNCEESDGDETRAAGPEIIAAQPGKAVVPKAKESQLKYKLRVADGPLAGGEFRDWESPLSIGRGLKNHVVLLDDAVSTDHAQIVQDGEHFFLADMQSANGTFLNGVKVVGRVPLTDGMKIKAGMSTMIFELKDVREVQKFRKIVLLSGLTVIVIVLLIKVLQPPDYAGQHINTARGLMNRGEWEAASGEFKQALKYAPGRAVIQQGLNICQAQITAKAYMALAQSNAAAGNYADAKEYCYKIERSLNNKYTPAKEMLEVLKQIEDAKIAIDHTNWTAAVSLLEEAQKTYPSSQLINDQLRYVHSEQGAVLNLERARAAHDHQQPEMEANLLKSIPANSVYYLAAKQALDRSESDQRVAEYLSKAREHYSSGELAGAMEDLGQGLKETPDDARLLEMQKKLANMKQHLPLLTAAATADQSANVDTLLECSQACKQVVNEEKDPLNYFRKQAEEALPKIQQRLLELAGLNAGLAAKSLKENNLKEASRLYAVAIKADPANQATREESDKLRQKILSECKSTFAEGQILAESNQPALAREKFQKVLALSLPGEPYYIKANRELDKLGAASGR